MTQMSSGGLVSALSGCKKTMSFTWIGWPGKHVSHRQGSVIEPRLTVQIPEADRALVNQRLLDEYNCYPVYLSDELADRHYNGALRGVHVEWCPCSLLSATHLACFSAVLISHASRVDGPR